MKLLLTLYIIGGLLNWGYLKQRPELWESAPDDFAKMIVPVGISFFWPVYWLGRGVLEVTKP